jgi:flagellar biosynthetic protein FliP
VAAVLAASGLVTMSPSQISVPLKLVLFVVADGWWLTAEMLLKTFRIGTGSA